MEQRMNETTDFGKFKKKNFPARALIEKPQRWGTSERSIVC